MISQLFILNTSSLPTDDGRILSLLTKERRKRVSRIIPVQKKQETIGAELLLLYALKGKYDAPLPLLYTEKGKPYVEGAEHFSLSHSDGMCICALCECETGADIEKLRDLSDSMKKRILSDGDSLRGAVHVWSAKEAYLKLTGDGIDGTIALRDIEAHEDKVTCEGRAACLFQTLHSDFVISVCTFAETDVEIIELEKDELFGFLSQKCK